MSTDVKAMCDRLVDERAGSLLATAEGRAALAAYLNGLDRTHGKDQAMCAHVRRMRARLAEREETTCGDRSVA